MAYTIAFSGKGGSGKTTLATLAIRYFLDKKMTPVLAVDADPNSNLNVCLGMEFKETIADVREEVLDKKVPEGIAKNEFISRRIDEILVEGDDVDLLVMGRPEGQGCYCAVNHLLRDYLNRLSKHYKAVVIDTEAGMEHLSRRTTDDLDALFIVANPEQVSIQAASRIQGISKKLKLKIKNNYLVLNRAGSKIPASVNQMLDGEKLGFVGTVPEDIALNDAVAESRAIIDMPYLSAYQAVGCILKNLK